MGLIKTALIGAAVYGAIKYITKKDELTGKSIVDDLKDKAPEWVDKAKGYKAEMENRYNNFAAEFPE
ncbi:YtxH domain-containing protein [Pedobacter sp. PWIIR3]